MVSRFIDVPTLQFKFLRPQKMSFNTKGGSVNGGLNALGEGISIDMTGGGLVTASYQECFVWQPEQHEYINYLSALLNRSTRFIAVPIYTDWMGPFPRVNGVPQANLSAPHSDGSTFSDGSEYTQGSVYGRILNDTPVNAGQIYLRLFDSPRPLRWSDWFSIQHDYNGDQSMGWRAYRYWQSKQIASGTTYDLGANRNFVDYQLAIDPPLRDAVPNATRVEFALPKCVMKFPNDFSLEWEVEGYWQSRPTLNFTEAF